MEVLLNDKIQEMVQEPPPEDQAVVTEFDIYIHQNLLSGSDYNSL